MFIRQKSAFSTNRISKYYFKQILYYDSKRRKEWKKSVRKQKKKEKAYQNAKKGKNNRCWQEGFFFSPPSDTAKNAITCFFSVKRFWYKVSRSYMSYDKLRFLFFWKIDKWKGFYMEHQLHFSKSKQYVKNIPMTSSPISPNPSPPTPAAVFSPFALCKRQEYFKNMQARI